MAVAAPFERLYERSDCDGKILQLGFQIATARAFGAGFLNPEAYGTTQIGASLGSLFRKPAHAFGDLVEASGDLVQALGNLAHPHGEGCLMFQQEGNSLFDVH